MNKANGFTLVELLVTLGVLLIVAGLAMSNYQDALIRAKTAKVTSEFRTLSAAIEVYASDHNSLPRMASARFYDDEDWDYYDGIPLNGTLSKALSTPVAYVSTVFLTDPFMSVEKKAPLDEQLFTYHVRFPE